MPEKHELNCAATCRRLKDAIAATDVEIRVGEQAVLLREKYNQEIRRSENNIRYCNMVLDEIKPMISDMQKYLNARKKESMQNINNALRVAREIIPESADGIHVEYDADEAWIATADGLTVQNTEGGGYRHTSSNFLRFVALTSNMSNLHTLFFDESFGAVSQENTANLSLYLDAVCKNAQIISIEQKPQIYSNVDCIMYTFKKDVDYTTVTRSEIKRDILAPTKEES